MQVRRYDGADRAGVLALAPRLREGVAPWRDAEAVAAAVTEWVRESLDGVDGGSRAVFVAEDNDRIVGVVTVGERAHFAGEIDGYVGELAVDAQATRHGVGRALITAAEDWARARGLRRLTLDTGAANTTARRFYAALGYAEEDVRLSTALV